MKEEIALQDQLLASLDDYTDHLTPDQLLVLPYLAHGVSIGKTAVTTDISPKVIRKWISENAAFNTALTMARRTISDWQMQRLNEVSIRAWDVVEKILMQEYEDADSAERREIARTARHIIDKLGLNKDRDLHVTHEVVAPELNISEDSAEAIAKYMVELEKYNGVPPTVEAEYTIKETDPRYNLHPETDFGKLNIDRENKTIQCHICGDWAHNFSDHVDEVHGLSFSEYKVMYRIGDDITDKWLREL